MQPCMSDAPVPAPRSLREVLAARLAGVRQRRGRRQAELAADTEAVGRRMHQTTIARTENAQRDVSVEELVALALALNVSPTNLLLPADGDELVAVTPELHVEPLWVRMWFYGQLALPLDADERTFMSEAPDYEWHQYLAKRHPAWVAVLELHYLIPRAIADPNPPSAETLRASARHLVDQVDQLADEVERRGMAG